MSGGCVVERWAPVPDDGGWEPRGIRQAPVPKRVETSKNNSDESEPSSFSSCTTDADISRAAHADAVSTSVRFSVSCPSCGDRRPATALAMPSLADNSWAALLQARSAIKHCGNWSVRIIKSCLSAWLILSRCDGLTDCCSSIDTSM